MQTILYPATPLTLIANPVLVALVAFVSAVPVMVMVVIILIALEIGRETVLLESKFFRSTATVMAVVSVDGGCGREGAAYS